MRSFKGSTSSKGCRSRRSRSQLCSQSRNAPEHEPWLSCGAKGIAARRDSGKQMLDLDSYEYAGEASSIRFKVIPNWNKSSKISTSLVFTYNEKRRDRDLAILDAWRKVVLRKKAAGVKVAPKSLDGRPLQNRWIGRSADSRH